MGRDCPRLAHETGPGLLSITSRTAPHAEETLDCVRELGSDGFIIQADVSQPYDIQHLLQTVEAEFGRLVTFLSSNARPRSAHFLLSHNGDQPWAWDMAVQFAGQGLPHWCAGGLR